MGSRTGIRHLTDLMMTAALILLMSYFLTGQEIHEWLGAGMLVLFVIHHILNIKCGSRRLAAESTRPFVGCKPPLPCWSFCVCWAPCSAGSG